ncbi:protein bicaudal C homolog 1 [Agrilus planipennis]|uniref:Protein bicaudal C homolog 1 n=1 Tax=Agrilus planipennis TaxID=224129 RepID=A0A7F5QVU6_AGRPL|nr:protein bicaudal C homolog 1 [Agrilus planipennis]
MACNFLAPRAVDLKTNSDTLSEISETGTGTSGWGSGWEDCREDLVDFIAKIGLREGEELYQVRFRVDRKKLEHMLIGDNEAPEPADTFFLKIMEDTNTHITWPSRLKVGARSKKDPHVRIAGRPNDVHTAKERIMTVLDTRSNRVIMKMDVSYTDHSHIIGKGGHSIKRVMEETQCHVHFPDSNRSNPTEKSNQVSIAGDIEGVERARGRVRNEIHVQMSMEISPQHHSIVTGKNHANLKAIMQRTNTQIMFPDAKDPNIPSLKKNPHVRIAGRPNDVHTAKERIMTVLDTRSNRVIMKMDVSYTDHSHIIGKGGHSIKRVMEETQCHVHFPDSNRSNPTEKSNQVSIAGDIEGVERARGRVRNLTPLIFSFELPIMPVSPDANTSYVVEIQKQYNVQVMFRTRPKLHATSVMVKGVEWEVQQTKQATILLMQYICDNLAGSLPLVLMFDLPEDAPNLQIEPEQISKIQSQLDVVINIRHKAKQNIMGCVIKGIERCATNIYEARNRILGIKEAAIVADIPSSYFPPQVYPITNGPPSINVQPVSPLISPLFSPTWQYSNPSTSYTHQPPFTGVFQPQLVYSMMQGTMSTSGYLSANSCSTDPNKDNTAHSSISSSGSVASPIASPKNVSPCYKQRNSNDSPLERTELSSVLSEMNMSGSYHGPTVNKRQDTTFPQYPLHDYEQRRLAGFRAMQSRSTGYRVPTSTWSGYGISHTSPGVIQTDTSASQEKENIWKSPSAQIDQPQPCASSGLMNISNITENTPTNVVNRITNSKWRDLPSLLASLGLEKYIGIFESHEVDLATFSSLTDEDLVGIGVHAFGARRKMLLAISD